MLRAFFDELTFLDGGDDRLLIQIHDFDRDVFDVLIDLLLVVC